MRPRCQAAALLIGILLTFGPSVLAAHDDKAQGAGTPPATDTSDKNKGTNSPAPQQTGGSGDQKSTSKGGGSGNSAPEIKTIIPAAPLAGATRLIIQGSNFRDQPSFTFTDPKGETFDETGAHVSFVSDQRADVDASLGLPGPWKIVAKNPNGPSSKPVSFNVLSHDVTVTSPEAIAFAIAILVATTLLIWVFASIWKGLKDAGNRGQWSFGDALSEESIYQPKEIRYKTDVITFASTSRLIALIGLLGILTLVVGVGYSAIWSLFVRGTTPDLSQARTFLLYSACVFAPYLANQLSSIFTPGVKPVPPESTPSIAITGVAPSALRSGAATQPVHFTGTGFRDGLSLTLTDPSNNQRVVGAANITSIAPTLVSANVVLDTPGSWTISATNPSGVPSPSFAFNVSGAPTIASADPAAPAHGGNPVPLTLVGTGFISGLTVSLQRPGAGGTVNVAAATVTATRVTINPTLDVQGAWSIVVTNPGNNTSAPFTLNVT